MKYSVPSRMLVSPLVSIDVVKRLMPSDVASRRPVLGRICISPQALATERALGSNVDSCAISAATM